MGEINFKKLDKNRIKFLKVDIARKEMLIKRGANKQQIELIKYAIERDKKEIKIIENIQQYG